MAMSPQSVVFEVSGGIMSWNGMLASNLEFVAREREVGCLTLQG
jgi:hypothetical protein